MTTPIAAAASAYANVARVSDPSAMIGRAIGGGEGSSTSFASVLKDALGAVNEAGKKSDIETRAMANGKSNLVDVVTAVSETEVAIDAVVAVRDKVIQAYEEIMRMPI